MTDKKKAVFLALTFLIIVGTYVYKNYLNKPVETPTTFITKTGDSTANTEIKTNKNLGTKEDLSRQFISSFFSFGEDSLKNVTELTDANLQSKLEKDSQNQPVEITNVHLIDSSTYGKEDQLVFTYTATDKNTKKEKKAKVLLIIETKENKQLIKDYEWSYEQEN